MIFELQNTWYGLVEVSVQDKDKEELIEYIEQVQGVWIEWEF